MTALSADQLIVLLAATRNDRLHSRQAAKSLMVRCATARLLQDF